VATCLTHNAAAPAQPEPSVSGLGRTPDQLLHESNAAARGARDDSCLHRSSPDDDEFDWFEGESEPNRAIKSGDDAGQLEAKTIPSASEREPPPSESDSTEALEVRLAHLGAGLAHSHEMEMHLAVAAAVMQARALRAECGGREGVSTAHLAQRLEPSSACVELLVGPPVGACFAVAGALGGRG
jgi:hypothetical protein